MFTTKLLICSRTILNKTVKSYTTSKLPIISCKRKEFNFNGILPGKLDRILLASDGWNHRKSRGDYFIVNRIIDKSKEIKYSEEDFKTSGIDEKIIECLKKEKILIPTDIQVKSIPILLSRQNALITAETGCGKTYAYLLPILHQILYWQGFYKNRKLNTPLVVILTPGRELVEQIYNVAEKLCESLNINIKYLIGGRTKQKMLNPTFEDVDLLVTTPGAFSKLVTTGIYNVNCVNHVVLDEADSLLDDSFIERITYILRKVKFHYHAKETSGAQLSLVSATLPKDLQDRLSFFVDPLSIRGIISDRIHEALPNVPQRFLRLGSSQKPIELLKHVRESVNKMYPVIVFSNKQETCRWISFFLNQNGIKCTDVNAKISAEMRIGIYDSFRNGEVNVISATDIISRGMDTVHVRHIINYDFPINTSDYVHRCGRIGRIGSAKNCHVTNFVSTMGEIAVVKKIEKSIRQLTSLPNVDANIKKIITSKVKKHVDAAEKYLASVS